MDGENVVDWMLMKILRAKMLLPKLNKQPEQDYMENKFDFLILKESNECASHYHPNYYQQHIKYLEQELEKWYHEHHGIVIERHILVREQDENIRALKYKIVNQRNSLADERRLTKDIILAEERRSTNIVIANVMRDFKYPDSYEECKKSIKAYKDNVKLRRKKVKVNKKISVKKEVETSISSKSYLLKGRYS